MMEKGLRGRWVEEGKGRETRNLPREREGGKRQRIGGRKASKDDENDVPAPGGPTNIVLKPPFFGVPFVSDPPPPLEVLATRSSSDLILSFSWATRDLRYSSSSEGAIF